MVTVIGGPLDHRDDFALVVFNRLGGRDRTHRAGGGVAVDVNGIGIADAVGLVVFNCCLLFVSWCASHRIAGITQA
jgi:hypothetical protein